MNQPLISVLITSYNREKYISEAIESVLNQTYRNIELIIVDDYSSDNTFSIIKHYEEKDNRVYIYQNDHNLGQFPNRNKAASLAKGEYLKYLDSDDVLYPNALEIYIGAMLKYPNACAAVQAHHHRHDLFLPFNISSEDALLSHYTSGSQILNLGPSLVMFKKSVFNEIGGFEESEGILKDTLLMLRMAEKGSIVLVQRDLCYWRLHADQITKEQSNHYNMIKERYLLNFSILSNPQSVIPYKKRAIIWNKIQRLYFLNVTKKILLKGKLQYAFNLFSNYKHL